MTAEACWLQMHIPRVAELYIGVIKVSSFRPCQVRKWGWPGTPHTLPSAFLIHQSHSPLGCYGPFWNRSQSLPEDQPGAVHFVVIVQLPQVDNLHRLYQVHKCPRDLSKGKTSL